MGGSDLNEKVGQFYLTINIRPAELELEFSDGSTERISLQDTSSGFQEFALERHVTSYVKIKIISTYEGSKYEDTVISEIELQ